jgi:hypothetical protein
MKDRPFLDFLPSIDSTDDGGQDDHDDIQEAMALVALDTRVVEPGNTQSACKCMMICCIIIQEGSLWQLYKLAILMITSLNI